MSDDAPSTAQVRAYLDQAVVDAADRWVGRSLDATAYADLVAAVLARREAMGSTELTRPMETAPVRQWPEPRAEPPAPPPWDGVAASDVITSTRPVAQFGVVMPDHSTVHVEPVGPVSYGPTSYDLVHAARAEELPVRPPGRHRSPPVPPEPAPHPIDLSDELTSVLSWLGRPDS